MSILENTAMFPYVCFISHPSWVLSKLWVKFVATSCILNLYFEFLYCAWLDSTFPFYLQCHYEEALKFEYKLLTIPSSVPQSSSISFIPRIWDNTPSPSLLLIFSSSPLIRNQCEMTGRNNIMRDFKDPARQGPSAWAGIRRKFCPPAFPKSDYTAAQ